MSFSVNTNNGATTALQYLTPDPGPAGPDPVRHQQRPESRRLPVTTARSTPSPRISAAQVAGYPSVINSINNGTSAIDVALSAGQSISDLLIQMKQKALSAADSSLDTASRQALNANFTALRDQITTIVKNATFNGFNLVNGSTNQITALASADGTPPHHHLGPEHEPVGYHRDPEVHGHDLDPGQGLDPGRDDPDLAHQRQLGPGQVVGWRREVLDPGDLRPEAVRHPDCRASATWSTPTWRRKAPSLQSLQVKQQLGIQALSIANQAPQTILSLFH